MHRRSVLRAGGALATASLTGIAGCTGILGGSGGDAVEFGAWLPAPEELLAEHYRASAFRPGSVPENAPIEAFRELEADGEVLDRLGVDREALDAVVRGKGFAVYRGEYDREGVTGELGGTLSAEGDHEGFELFASEESDGAFAVGDEGIVRAESIGEEAPVDIAKSVVDAKAGDAATYPEAVSGMETLLSGLSKTAYVAARTYDSRQDTVPEGGRFEGAVGWGVAVDPGQYDTTNTWTVAFEGTDAASVDPLREWVDRSFGELEDVSVSANDSLVTAEGTVTTHDARAYRQFPVADPVRGLIVDPRDVYERGRDRGRTTVELSSEDGTVTWGPVDGEGGAVMTGYVDADRPGTTRWEDHDHLSHASGWFSSGFGDGVDGIDFDPDSFRGIAFRVPERADFVVDGEVVVENASLVRYSTQEGVFERESG